MIVVSNSSPIISLSSVGRIDLLEKLFSEIHIPSHVYTEIDRWEAEAIELSLELKSDLLILDDRLGLKIAKNLGIESMGT